MLTELKTTRMRSRVDAINAQGQIQCSVYPTMRTKESFCLNPDIAAEGLDVTKLAVGMPFDVLMVGNQVVAIESPAIHPFDIPKLYPNGLVQVTAQIENPAEGINGAITAKYATAAGQQTLYRITSLTRMFQAQADEPLREKIYQALKKGDSVNLWIDPTSGTTQTGYPEPQDVIDVQYLSVNFR